MGVARPIPKHDLWSREKQTNQNPGRWRRKANRTNELRVPGRGGEARSFKSTAVGEERVLVFGSRVSGKEVSAGTSRAWGGGVSIGLGEGFSQPAPRRERARGFG